MTTTSNQPSAATRQNGGGQPPPGEHDPYEHPRHQHRDEQGEQWQHGESGDQALISKASRQPGAVQRSTLTEPGDDPSKQPTEQAEPAVSATTATPTPRAAKTTRIHR